MTKKITQENWLDDIELKADSEITDTHEQLKQLGRNEFLLSTGLYLSKAINNITYCDEPIHERIEELELWNEIINESILELLKHKDSSNVVYVDFRNRKVH